MAVNTLLSKQITLNDKVVSWKEIEGEIIVLDKKTKDFYELNKSASFIWKQIVAKKKVSSIITALIKKHKKVKKTLLEKDVLSFVNKGIKKKMFVIKK